MDTKHIIRLLCMVGCLICLCGCRQKMVGTPKPRGYMRFEFPQKDYALFDTVALPFSFERAVQSDLVLKKNEGRLKWVDITYPDLGGVVFLSYIALRGPEDLRGEIDTSYALLKQHFNFSSGVEENQFFNPKEHVYATTYLLKGSGVASTYQFWATDSVHHFLRGSLYLDCVPNNDSLAPVLDYLQQDLDHLLETLHWRDNK